MKLTVRMKNGRTSLRIQIGGLAVTLEFPV